MSNGTETNYLSMQDEEIINASFPEEQAAVPTETTVDTEQTTDIEDHANETDSEVSDETPAVETEGASVVDDPAETSDKETAEEVKVNKEQVTDYQAVYNRIMAPFKANGKDIEVKSVDDAITLMQMGANYNKKMAALKPNMKVLKLLERNDLLDENRLSFLIDLDKKNPDAINKLLKDSGVDPLELDLENAKEYVPQTRQVDDREIALDMVLNEISDTPSYARTLGFVSQDWDEQSKQTIADHPQLLKVINDHVDRGIYDLINSEVERARMLGKMNGVSYIEAYRQIGDAIQARGGFNHLGNSQMQVNQPTKVVAPKSKVDEAALKDKKRAATPTTGGLTNKTTEDFNPLSMSDAEFEKYAQSKFQ